MKFKIKEWQHLFDRRDERYVTDIEMNGIIDKVISFNQDFRMPSELSFTTQDAVNWLKKLKDKDNIWVAFKDILFFRSENIKHRTFYLNTSGTWLGGFEICLYFDHNYEIKSISLVVFSVRENCTNTYGVFRLQYINRLKKYTQEKSLFF